MRKAGFVLLVVTVMFLVGNLAAGIAQNLTYQGRLLDSGGNPVPDGLHDIKFEIFDAEVFGTSVWVSPPVNVLTSDGFFNYNLADSALLPDNLFANDTGLWLEVTVVGDPPLTPRTRLTSVGYAYHALRADSVANSPGVTQLIYTPSVNLLNGFSVIIATDSINAPAAGYVTCQATMSVSAFKTAIGTVAAVFALTDSTQSITTDQENYFVLEPAYGSGSFEQPMHLHRVYEVAPGWNRFSIRAADFGDPGQSIAARNTKLTLTYYDRSYGTIQLASPPSPPATVPQATPIDDATRARLMEHIGQN